MHMHMHVFLITMNNVCDEEILMSFSPSEKSWENSVHSFPLRGSQQRLKERNTKAAWRTNKETLACFVCFCFARKVGRRKQRDVCFVVIGVIINVVRNVNSDRRDRRGRAVLCTTACF